MKKRIKILYLIDELQPAGTERQLLLIAESLPRNEFDPYIGVLQPTPYQTQLKLKTPIITFSRKGPVLVKNLPALSSLREFLRKEGIDIVQTQLVDATILGTLAVLLSSPRPILIATRRNAYYMKEQRPFVFLMHKILARWADAILVNSQFVSRKCEELEGISSRRITVIPNGIQVEEFARVPGEEAKRRIGLEGPVQVIGVVANWRPVKGLICFLNAAANICEVMPSVRFVLVGQGPQKTELQRRVRKLKLDHHVRFLEGISAASEVIPAFDVAVQCSLSESFSNVLLEYMACARPIVATRVGDADQIIQHGVDGLLVEPDDADGLASAVLSLLRFPEHSSRMGALAKSKVERYWALGRISESYQTYYRMITGRDAEPVLHRRAAGM